MAVPKIHLTVTNKRDKSIELSNYDITPTDYVFWFIVKPCNSTTTDDSDALLKYEDEYTITTNDDGDTVILIDIMKSTTDIDADTYKYEFNLEEIATGNIIKVISGNYVVESDIQKVF